MSTSQNRLIEAVLTSTHGLCFEQKYEKYFQFLVIKFSVYLNRHVFVMWFCYVRAVHCSSFSFPLSAIDRLSMIVALPGNFLYYSRTSMTRTSLGSKKFVQDTGSSSH